MAYRGRKPKPTRLRLAHDSRGPVNQHEPQHPELDEAVPDELKDPLARSEWIRIVAVAKGTGHLQALDQATMLTYCLKYAQLIHVEEEAAKHPFIVKGVNNGPLTTSSRASSSCAGDDRR